MVKERVKILNTEIAIYKPQIAKQVLVTIHGFAGDSDSSVICALAKEMTKDGFLVISFDLPNHGKNITNKPLKLSDCLDLVKKVHDFALNYKVPVSYFATSFGAYLLLSLLDELNPTGKVILRAPAVYMGKILSDVILPENGYNVKDLDNGSINLGYQSSLYVDKKFLLDLQKNSLKNISYKTPLYIIQGKKDDTVDWKQNEKYFNLNTAQNVNYYYFDNADHRFKNYGELEKIISISKNILLSKN